MTHRILELPKGGFNFDNYHRNAVLEQKGFVIPKAMKTGTTTVGITYKDGVVIGADTRATDDDIIADKGCLKLHYIAPNLYCAGAGTAADTQYTTELISSQLELHRLTSGRESRAVTARLMLSQLLFKYQGHVSAALILGGVDITGPSLCSIYPHGSTDNLPFVSTGSGSIAALSVVESRWRPNLERQEAIDMAKDAIESGIFNDLGSGSNVNLVVIEKGKVDKLLGYSKPNDRPPNEKSYKYRRGTTAVLKENIHEFVTITEVTEGEAMDTS